MNREEAIELLEDVVGFVEDNQGRDYDTAFRMAIEALSADAVHGEWVRKYDDKVNCYWYECDQCGEYRPRNQFGNEYNANFCPNCGARMKGGEK